MLACYQSGGLQETYRVAVSKAVHVGSIALVNAGNDGGLDRVERVGRGAGRVRGGGLGTDGNGESASDESRGETHGD